MTIICPKCSQPIAGENVNATTNIAFCRPCGEAFALASVMPRVPEVPRALAPAVPQSQLEVQNGVLTLLLPRGGKKTLGCFLLLFSIFWNGFLGLMFGISIYKWITTGVLDIRSEEGKPVTPLYFILF